MAADAGDNDPLLAPLLSAAERERGEEIAELLADHALPVADAILLARLKRLGPRAAAMLEDLRGDVVVRLLHRLERLLADPAVHAIHSFRDYVAVVAYHRIDDFVRSSQPARVALANRLRYLLGKDPELAVWSHAPGDLVAGFVRWREHRRPPVSVPAELAAELDRVDGGGSPRQLRTLVVAALSRLGGPVELAALVSLLASALRLTETSIGEPMSPLAAAGPDPLARLESQDYLRRLWLEIVALPGRQRLALLLNLRDGRGDSVARLLPLTGVATIEDIGRVLGLEPARFAALWGELPVDDTCIAALLGDVSRQQVINLRKSARERLARRMARLE